MNVILSVHTLMHFSMTFKLDMKYSKFFGWCWHLNKLFSLLLDIYLYCSGKSMSKSSMPLIQFHANYYDWNWLIITERWQLIFFSVYNNNNFTLLYYNFNGVNTNEWWKCSKHLLNNLRVRRIQWWFVFFFHITFGCVFSVERNLHKK